MVADTMQVRTASPVLLTLDGEELEVTVVKMGGSSLTDKANMETIHEEALEWFARTIAKSIDSSFLSPQYEGPNVAKRVEKSSETTSSLTVGANKAKEVKRKRAFVIIHGAGKASIVVRYIPTRQTITDQFCLHKWKDRLDTTQPKSML